MTSQDMAESPEKREQSVLNIVCYAGAGLFLLLVAYNLFRAGTVISTDGLFFTVVPLLLALCFLVMPAMDLMAKRKAGESDSAAADAHAGAAGLILLLPTGLYIFGCAAAVLASFLVLALFHRSAAVTVEPARRILPRAVHSRTTSCASCMPGGALVTTSRWA